MGKCIDEDNGGVKNRCWILFIMFSTVVMCTAMGFVIGLGMTNSANNAAVDMTAEATTGQYSKHITGFTAGIGAGMGIPAGSTLGVFAYWYGVLGGKKQIVIMESVVGILLVVWLLVSGILVFHLDGALESPEWFQYTKTVFYTLLVISSYIGVHFLILGTDKLWVPCCLSMKGCCNSENTGELDSANDSNAEPKCPNSSTLPESGKRSLTESQSDDEKSSDDSIPKNSSPVTSIHDIAPSAKNAANSRPMPERAPKPVPPANPVHAGFRQAFKKIESEEELRQAANDRLNLIPKQYGDARFKWTSRERYFNDWLVFQLGGKDPNKDNGTLPKHYNDRRRLCSRTVIRLLKSEKRP